MLTVGGKSHGLMVGTIGFSKCAQVAAHAFGGESETVELTDGANFVAGVAIDGGMGADQRKAILMLVDVVNGDLPAIGVVTEFTFGAVLAAMEIRMAILTLHRSVTKNEILVAIRALHFCVPSMQRESRAGMVEFQLGAQRLPFLRGVTLLARDLQFVAVRAMNRSVESDLLSERNSR